MKATLSHAVFNVALEPVDIWVYEKPTILNFFALGRTARNVLIKLKIWSMRTIKERVFRFQNETLNYGAKT